MRVKNSVFLVTGGASNSFGRAMVKHLLQKGAHVIICDLPNKDLHIFGDDKAIFLAVDVTDEDDVNRLIAIIHEKFTKLDGVINCIDYQEQIPVYNFKLKEPHTLEKFSNIIQENVLGPFNIIRQVVPLISLNVPKKSSGRGIIINLSFENIRTGYSAYSAAKASVIRMSEALNFALQGIQIRCVAVIADADSEFSIKTDNNNGICFDHPDGKRFAEFVTTIIETQDLNVPILRLGK